MRARVANYFPGDRVVDPRAARFGMPLGWFLERVQLPAGPLWSLALGVRMCFPTPSSLPLLFGDCPYGQSNVGPEYRVWRQTFTPPRSTYVTLHKIPFSSNFICFTCKVEIWEVVKGLNERIYGKYLAYYQAYGMLYVAAISIQFSFFCCQKWSLDYLQFIESGQRSNSIFLST